MKRALLLGLGLGLALDAPVRALAEPVTEPASGIAAATESAWQIAVEAREVAAFKAGAAAEQAVAGAWWVEAPALELSHRSGDWGNNPGERESEVAVAIPMWWPGQRASARRAAQADVEQATAAEALARLTVAGQVRELAWKLAEVDAELGGAAAIARHVRTLVDDTERRVTAGDSPRTDLLTARAELIEAEAREGELRRSRRAALAEWAVLTGQPRVNNPAEVLFWLVGERPTQRLLQAQAAPGAGLGAPAQAL
jgi:outer membrane protein TolC